MTEFRHGAILALFTVLATAAMMLTWRLTRPAIEAQQRALQQQRFSELLPAGSYDNDLLASCRLLPRQPGEREARRLWLAEKQGQPVAAIIESTAPDGYAGAIHLLVATGFNGEVLGARVTEHHETPGLGDKIELRVSDWITHFSGRTIAGPQDTRFAVRKDGGEIDQFTGATITPRAVTNAIRRTVLMARTLPARLASLPHCETP